MSISQDGPKTYNVKNRKPTFHWEDDKSMGGAAVAMVTLVITGAQ